MDKETKRIAIWELNNKVNEFVRDKNLFCGGCCFSAYVLSNVLTKIGIKYEVLIFQSSRIREKLTFNDAVNDDGCDHVAIEVRLGAKRVIIGRFDDLNNYYRMFHIKPKIRRYKDITPCMLRNAYYSNTWNHLYNTNNNRPLSISLNKIARKYI